MPMKTNGNHSKSLYINPMISSYIYIYNIIYFIQIIHLFIYIVYIYNIYIYQSPI